MSPYAPTPDDQATTDAPLLDGRYQLLGRLGQGGMGTVFRARDAKLERLVALKMLPEGEGSAPHADAVRRFRREAKALAKLVHPGIIQAYDSGEDGGKPFLVMELVEDGVNRDPKSPDFLRPAKDSPLATAGAGSDDLSLPRYVGALPPEGVPPWDWDRAWRSATKTTEDGK